MHWELGQEPIRIDFFTGEKTELFSMTQMGCPWSCMSNDKKKRG